MEFASMGNDAVMVPLSADQIVYAVATLAALGNPHHLRIEMDKGILMSPLAYRLITEAGM